eukprot:m.128665 g.128665  ORF g.128665 m.128665 type:complete len:512 (-) comp19903_c0_seq1:43-1578(-)
MASYFFPRLPAAAERAAAVLAQGRALHTARTLRSGGLDLGVNDNLINMKYAVRGEMAILAQQIQKEIKAGTVKHPFPEIVACNIGNPQAVGMAPITFPRQVLSLCLSPFLLRDEQALKLFPADAVERAHKLLLGGSFGAYSDSKGLEVVREEVARYIHTRDGHPANADHIFLTGGASEGVKLMLNLFVRDRNDGILVPIPQYPLYSASLTQFGGELVEYYLDEKTGWSCGVDQITENIKDARAKGIKVRGIVVINPGNPTGQVLSEQNMREIVTMCEKEGLVLMADEVYQSNIYKDDKPFVSFKKVVRDLRANVPLASFHSVSKGMFGECGLRGGYMELVNFPDTMIELVTKCTSVNLCSNIPGQAMVELMVNHPTSESKDLFDKEYNGILESLKRKAVMLAGALNSLEGMSCNESEGAMYLFPRVHLPAKAVQKAKSTKTKYSPDGEEPDLMYCKQMLQETGVCVVPGSGFKQEKDTYHFRITFLPQESKMAGLIERLTAFHNAFMAKFA